MVAKITRSRRSGPPGSSVWLLGPPLECATIRPCSSPTTVRVAVWPPSTPRKSFMTLLPFLGTPLWPGGATRSSDNAIQGTSHGRSGQPFEVGNGRAHDDCVGTQVKSLPDLLGLVHSPFQDYGNIHFPNQQAKQIEPWTRAMARLLRVSVKRCADQVNTESGSLQALLDGCHVGHNERLKAGS